MEWRGQLALVQRDVGEAVVQAFNRQVTPCVALAAKKISIFFAHLFSLLETTTYVGL